MKRLDWSQPTTNTAARHRVAGRRRINRERQLTAIRRQVKALNLRSGGCSLPEIAARLNVSRTTVWRYLKPYGAKFGQRSHYLKRSYGLQFCYPPGRWTAYRVR